MVRKAPCVGCLCYAYSMKINQVSKGRTIKTVVMTDVYTETDQDLFYAAAEAANETPARLFGRDITRYPNSKAAKVVLYID